jgi:hypothetical protein
LQNMAALAAVRLVPHLAARHHLHLVRPRPPPPPPGPRPPPPPPPARPRPAARARLAGGRVGLLVDGTSPIRSTGLHLDERLRTSNGGIPVRLVVGRVGPAAR